MYAIQTDTKIGPKTQFFDTFEEAQDALASAVKLLREEIRALQAEISKGVSTIALYDKKVARFKQKIAELGDRPYKEVYKKIGQAEHTLANLVADQKYFARVHLAQYRRHLAAAQRQLASNARIVKVEQQVVFTPYDFG